MESTTGTPNQYAHRDIMRLDRQGNYFSRHMSAMTGEELHDKADIAAELAHRDALLDDMRKTLVESATVLANINTYCQRAKVGVWGDSASQALIDDHRRQAERLQRIEAILKEWERGCSNTEGHHPAQCVECTSGAIDAIKTQLNS